MASRRPTFNFSSAPCLLESKVVGTDDERSLRGVALGRSNWTFLGSDRGGRTMAVLRSFISSCELVKVDPFAFRDVLSRIATHSLQKLEDLLPHRWAASRA